MFDFLSNAEEWLYAVSEAIDTINYNVSCDMDNLILLSNYIEDNFEKIIICCVISLIFIFSTFIINIIMLVRQGRMKKMIAELQKEICEKKE